MSDKPPNHGTYEIWHDGRTHAADVESVEVYHVWQLTRRRPELWQHGPGVTLHTDSPRATRTGDVIVDPTCGAWKVEEDGFLAVEPPGPVKERMEREGITPQHMQLLQDWLADMLHVATAVHDPRDDMPTTGEWQDIKAEWTHDYSLRRLEERVVRYEDEPHRPLDRESPSNPDPASRARYQRRGHSRGTER
jgi:hypothetical protein